MSKTVKDVPTRDAIIEALRRANTEMPVMTTRLQEWNDAADWLESRLPVSAEPDGRSCASCGTDPPTSYSLLHDAHFCPACDARENSVSAEPSPHNAGRCRVCGEWRGPDGCCQGAEPSPDVLRLIQQAEATIQMGIDSAWLDRGERFRMALDDLRRAREALASSPAERICRYKGDRGECLAPDCNCPERPSAAPSPDALRGLRAVKTVDGRIYAPEDVWLVYEASDGAASSPAEPTYEWRAVWSMGSRSGDVGPFADLAYATTRLRDLRRSGWKAHIERRTAPGPWRRVPDDEGRRDG